MLRAHVVTILISYCFFYGISKANEPSLLEPNDFQRKLFALHISSGNIKQMREMLATYDFDLENGMFPSSFIDPSGKPGTALKLTFCVDEEERREEMMIELLEKGARPETPLKNILKGKTYPFHMATCYNETKIMTLLMAYHIDPNKQDDLGNTALHYAFSYGNIEAINFLLDLQKINLDLENEKGLSPRALIPTHLEAHVKERLKINETKLKQQKRAFRDR